MVIIIVLMVIPIVVTPVEIVTDSSDVHPKKANVPKSRVSKVKCNDNDDDVVVAYRVKRHQ